MVPKSFLRKQCSCDDWQQMECTADRQMDLDNEFRCRWFDGASAYQQANRLAAIQLTPLRRLAEKKSV